MPAEGNSIEPPRTPRTRRSCSKIGLVESAHSFRIRLLALFAVPPANVSVSRTLPAASESSEKRAIHSDPPSAVGHMQAAFALAVAFPISPPHPCDLFRAASRRNWIASTSDRDDPAQPTFQESRWLDAGEIPPRQTLRFTMQRRQVGSAHGPFQMPFPRRLLPKS